MNTKPMILARDVDRAYEDWEQLQAAYLRQHKWTYTSNNPGSLWLWVKKVKGKEMRLSTAVAMTLQGTLTPDPVEDIDEAIEPIMKAIRMMRGVIDVAVGKPINASTYSAKTQARIEIASTMAEVFYSSMVDGDLWNKVVQVCELNKRRKD